MSDNFSAIWKNRSSTKAADQTALCLEIRGIFLRSSVATWLNKEDPEKNLQNDFFQDFYINKIFHALSTGLAISSPDYDDMPVGQLIHMMKQYHISFHRKEIIRISSHGENTDNIEDHQLSDSAENIQQQFSQKEMQELAKLFVTHSADRWVQPLLLKSARGDKLSGNDYPRRAKLGLTLKQSFHTGAQSIDDYHKNTIIGRWITVTYVDEVVPLSQYFLADILKSLHQAALSIDRKERR